ncbi:MAG: type IV pilus assembly protein PilM [Candidatus Omnitrophica bacterium]|nr:type IV pilus assembly protein PilM [Candidatus Omnitrophota bacterium]
MFKNYRESIGLEIGDGLVKAMQIRSTDKENKLLGFEIVEVNFRDGRQGIVNAIKAVLEKLGVNRKKQEINISVSGESVMVRDIHWPQMSDDEIRKALKFEVERQVHYKIDEIVFDYYSVLDKTIAETKTRVILVAAKKDLIENYAGLIEAAGYQCGFVEVDTFSLLNCFYVNGPQVSPGKAVAIINVGMEVTNIDIIKGRIVGLTKDAFVAWSNLIDALPENFELDFTNINALKGIMGSDDIYELSLFIINALSNQIRRTIEFYESQGRDTVDEIFLSGKVVMYKNLDKHLQNILGLKVTRWNPINSIDCSAHNLDKEKIQKNSEMMALCAGLACHRSFEINLLAAKKEKKQNKLVAFLIEYKGLLLTFLICLSVFISLWIVLITQVKTKEKNIKILLRENEKLASVIAEIEEMKMGKMKLKEQEQIARILLSRRIYWSRKFYDLSKCLPEKIWLTEVYIKGAERVSHKDLFDFEINRGLGKIADLSSPTISQEKIPEISFVIKGIAYSAQEETMLSDINSFIYALKENKNFIQDFKRIELKRSFRQLIKDTATMRFEIECFIK